MEKAAEMATIAERQDEYCRGVRMVRYDLVKELAIVTGVVLVVVVALAAFLSSPDVPPLTVQQWVRRTRATSSPPRPTSSPLPEPAPGTARRTTTPAVRYSSSDR